MTASAKRRTKRSSAVRLALLGATAFGMAACREEQVEATAFPDRDACLAAAGEEGSWYSAEDCDAAFAEAEQVWQDTAPRYADQALCEEEHDGGCVVEQRDNGTSVFLPLMAGYMIGNMLGRSSFGAQPLYKTKAGKFATASGTTLSGNRGGFNTTASSFRSGPSTRAAQPMTRAAVRSTGGFGASRTMSTGSRGFSFGG